MVSRPGNAISRGAADSRQLYLREVGLPVLFGAIVLLISATLLLGVNVTALHDNLRRVDRAQQALTQISILENSILGDELSVRGYALTGDARFLRYQQAERQKSLRARDALSRLVTDEPDHLAQFHRVQHALSRHMDTFGMLTGANAPAVAKAIVDPGIRASMRGARESIEQLQAEEMRDLGEHQREMTNQISRAFGLAVCLIVAAFVLGGVGLLASQVRPPLRR